MISGSSRSSPNHDIELEKKIKKMGKTVKLINSRKGKENS